MLGQLAPEFVKNTTCSRPQEGARWLAALPRIVGEIERDWHLQVGAPFADLSYHFVAPCRSLEGGGEAVLKLGFPEENSPLLKEKRMLEIFGGRGAVKLLRFDESRPAMLIEKLSPGENLVGLCRRDDRRATAVAIGVMRRILREAPAKSEFPTLAEWVGDLGAAEGTLFPQTAVRKARSYFEELIGGSKKRYLLHGDLHHQNILSAEREPYLAIDPKGICGGAAGFEISTFLNNPRGWLISHPDRRRIQSARLGQFSEAFEIAPADLARWAYAEAVLAAWWTYEEGRADWKKWIACAEIWEDYQV